MKPNSSAYSWLRALACAAAVVPLAAAFTEHGSPYVVHEWGTFTSVQGGDGLLLAWRPLQTSRLPGFVYDWQNPGFNRLATAQLLYGKGGVVSLQRMETPVIYFYAKEKQEVDVSVRFPKGMITEWYPQADRVGPAMIRPPAFVVKLDSLAYKAGVKPTFTFASLLRNSAVAKDSRIRWAHVEILPPAREGEAAPLLPHDSSGSHYFAARETEANFLQARVPGATNGSPEHEKFIFYRGVGNFQTPLRVTMNAENEVTVANTGTEPLTDLFLLGLQNQAGKFIQIERVEPGQSRTARLNISDHSLGGEQLSAQLGEQMAAALVHQGLYAREARAMIKTWQDSWFEDEGVRVLYVLPRGWTDQTLPMNLDPAPRELVRVMVGRAEVIDPSRQHRLAAELVKAQQGDAEAQDLALAEFKKLGRFAEPALRLATVKDTAEQYQSAWHIYQASVTR